MSVLKSSRDLSGGGKQAIGVNELYLIKKKQKKKKTVFCILLCCFFFFPPSPPGAQRRRMGVLVFLFCRCEKKGLIRLESERGGQLNLVWVAGERKQGSILFSSLRYFYMRSEYVVGRQSAKPD